MTGIRSNEMTMTMTMSIFYSTIDIQIEIIMYNSLENQIINWSGDYYPVIAMLAYPCIIIHRFRIRRIDTMQLLQLPSLPYLLTLASLSTVLGLEGLTHNATVTATLSTIFGSLTTIVDIAFTILV